MKIIVGGTQDISTNTRGLKMHLSVGKAQDLVFDVIDMVNKDLPASSRADKSPETVLHGIGSAFDSLGLVNLLTGIEHTVNEDYGYQIDILDDDIILDLDGPLRSVSALAAYLSKRANAQGASN